MLYRVSLHQHGIGEIVLPGRFGEQQRAFRPGGPYPVEPNFTPLLIEIALESARKAVAPSAPSRLDCIFACETLHDAYHFRSRYRGGDGVVLGIEPVSDDIPMFRGNFSAISTTVGPQPYVDYISDWARDYWTVKPDEITEILIGGPVRVLTGPIAI